jgi:hypothetical protein
VLAVVVTVGGVVRTVALTKHSEDAPVPSDSQISVDPEGMDQLSQDLDHFHSYFTPAGEDLVTELDCITTQEGMFCRRPYAQETIQNSQSLNSLILAATQPTVDSFLIHNLSDLPDIDYRAQMMHGWLYLEDADGRLPSLAVDVLTGDIYNAGDLY